MPHEDTQNDTPSSLLAILRAGAGCASGIGWMWFSGLQIFWPQALKATVFSRPASSLAWLVLVPMVLCWPGVGLCFERGRARTSRFFFHVLHVFAFLFLLQAALQAAGLFPAVLPEGLFFGLAAACLGLFGFAAVACLPPRAACLGLVAAAGFSCALVCMLSALSLENSPFTMPLLVIVSWACNTPLVSGRCWNQHPGLRASPLRNEQKMEGFFSYNYTMLLCFLFVCYFFQSTLIGMSSPHMALAPAWSGMLLTCLGAVFACMLFCRTTHGAFPLVASLGFAMQILAPLLGIPSAGLFVGEGLLAAAITIAASLALRLRLAGDATDTRLPWFHIGLLLGMFTLLVNAGFHFGSGIAESIGSPVAIALAAAAATLVIAYLGRMRRKLVPHSAAGATQALALPPAQDSQSCAADACLTILTPRERDIAALLCAGLTNQAICSRTGLSENTVRTHLKNLYRKAAASNRQELLAKLAATGLFRRSGRRSPPS